MAGKARTLTLRTKVEVTGADKLKNLGKRLQTVGAGLTAGVTLPIAGIGSAMVQSAIEAEQSQRRLENTFRTMRADAWTNVAALDAQAEALANATTFDDDQIKELQGTLLTFGNITGDAFTRATETAVDMAAFFGGEASDSAIQLGKALNNPIDGISALTRVGVSFTDTQKEQIRLFQESGDLASAQGVILDELAREFGDAAETMADTAGGKLKQALNELGEAGEAFGVAMLPLIEDLAGAIKGFAEWLQEIDPSMRDLILRVGGVAAALGPLLLVLGSIVRAIGDIKTLAPGMALVWGKLLPPVGAALALHEVEQGFQGILDTLFGHENTLQGLWDAAQPTETDIEQFEGQIRAWGDRGVRTIEEAKAAAATAAGAIPGEMVESMADAFRTEQEKLRDPINQLVEFMNTHLSPAREKAYLQGFLASSELANGLASNDPIIRAKSAEMRDAALSRLTELSGQAYQYGRNTAISLANGMRAELGTVSLASYALATHVRNPIRIESEPPDRNSPLYGITKWGGNIVKTIAAGIQSEASTIPSALYGALQLPALGTPALSRATVPLAGGSGGTTIINNFNIEVRGDAVRDEKSLAETIWRSAYVSVGQSLVR